MRISEVKYIDKDRTLDDLRETLIVYLYFTNDFLVLYILSEIKLHHPLTIESTLQSYYRIS